jgi:glycosyltransferase involved in cell wall biosynthesis
MTKAAIVKAQILMQQLCGRRAMLETHKAVDKPLVSVIIPTYNCLAFLPLAIKSVQKQQISDLEIIVLDDGSTDLTWYYLQLAAQCEQRIRPVKLDGVGVARARNHGIEIARGQYIAFLDADDYWFARKLATQLAFHQSQPKSTLSFCNYMHFKNEHENLGDCFGYWPGFARILDKQSQTDGYRLLQANGTGTIYAENIIGTSCVMINRQAMGSDLYFDENLSSAEDWDFWIKASLRGPIGFTTSIDMAYLMRPGSETSQQQLRLQSMYTIMKRHFKPVLLSSPGALFTSFSRLLTGYAEHHREQKYQLKACGFHVVAFIFYPSRRSLVAMLADIKSLLWSKPIRLLKNLLA